MSFDDVHIDIMDPAFDSNSEYYDSEEERELAATKDTTEPEDPEQAYKRWLLHWGTTDMEPMFYTPAIKSKQQIEAFLKIQRYVD